MTDVDRWGKLSRLAVHLWTQNPKYFQQNVSHLTLLKKHSDLPPYPASVPLPLLSMFENLSLGETEVRRLTLRTNWKWEQMQSSSVQSTCKPAICLICAHLKNLVSFQVAELNVLNWVKIFKMPILSKHYKKLKFVDTDATKCISIVSVQLRWYCMNTSLLYGHYIGCYVTSSALAAKCASWPQPADGCN